jgi:hypothetical protein
MLTLGYLDFVSTTHAAGWALYKGAPARLAITVDDCVVGDCLCAEARRDVVEAGISVTPCGFTFRFPRALTIADRVIAARFADGKELQNSPCPHQRIDTLGFGISSKLPGIELGPLDHPFIVRPQYNVLYADHASKDDIRKKYPAEAFQAEVADIDIIWPPGRDLALAVAGRQFAYAVASHVIEHVPDPIGWLDQLASVLCPGARINLAIPEKTRTFDRLRALSTPADVLDAHFRRLGRPNFRQIFDHATGVDHPDYGAAYAMAENAEREGRYIDVHCHVWTYESFLASWSVIDALGLLPLKLDRSWEPITGSNEFIVSFLKLA